MKRLTDKEFIESCETLCKDGESEFKKEDVVRMATLAGLNMSNTECWPDYVTLHEEMKDLIEMARKNIENGEKVVGQSLN